MLRDNWMVLLGKYQSSIFRDDIYAGEAAGFYPHVVYGGVQRFSESTMPKLGRLALLAWEQFASSNLEFARKVLPMEVAPETDADSAAWYQSVYNQLTKQAVFDFRIDFEDGFGYKPKAMYLSEAARAGSLLAKMPTIQTRFGIRILPFQHNQVALSVEILTTFLESFFKDSKTGALPANFVVTLPKVKQVAEIQLFEKMLSEFEGMYSQRIEMELMLESPEALEADLTLWLRAAGGKCTGLHLGAYDLLSALNVPADFQELTHEFCRSMLLKSLVAAYGKNIRVSTGAALQLAIPPHSNPENETQKTENQLIMEKNWAILANYHLSALRMGIFQGWDLHPNQIPIRIAVYHAFFQKTFSKTIQRLQHFESQGQEAVRSGQQFDDLASVRGLLNTVTTGRLCGAYTPSQLSQIDAIQINLDF